MDSLHNKKPYCPRAEEIRTHGQRKKTHNAQGLRVIKGVTTNTTLEEDAEEDALPIGRVLIRKPDKPLKRKAVSNNDTEKATEEGKCDELLLSGSGNCRVSKQKRKFREGDMVWGKVKSHPWWPGQIYNPSFATSMAKRSRRSGHVLVAFFGDATFGWFTESNLVPFEPTFAHKSKQTMSRNFCDAVDDAIDELGRRAALGLMCGCSNSFSSTAREGHIEVSVPGYEAPVIYSDRLVKEAKDGFQPAQMLAFMQRMAVSPWCGEDRVISGIKFAAQVRAYRAAIAVPVTAEYRLALRLSQRGCLQDVADSEDVWDRHATFSDKAGAYREALLRAPVKDENGHSETKDQGRKSVGEGETSYKEDIYVFKRRDGVDGNQSSASGGSLMNGVEIREHAMLLGEREETDDVSKYVFQKRSQRKEAQSVNGKKGKNKAEQGLYGEEYDIQVRRRKIETTKPTSRLDKKNVDKHPLKRKASEIETSPGCCLNTDLGTSDRVGLKFRKTDMKKESHCCISNSNDKSIPEKSRTNLRNNTIDEVDTEGHILLEKQGENEHPTESNQIKVDTSVELAGENASIKDLKNNLDNGAQEEIEVPVDVHIGKVDGIGTLRVPECLSDSRHNSQFVDVHSNHGDYSSLKDKACLDRMEILTTVAAVEGQGIVAAVEGQGISNYPRFSSENAIVILLKKDEGIEERITSSGETEMSKIPEGHHVDGHFGVLDVDKCIPRTQEDVGNIHIASETGIFETTESAIGSEINVVAAGDTLMFANEAMVDVFPTSQSVPSLDHTVGKKSVQETCHDEINSMSTVLLQNAMNSCHNQLSLEKQVTWNGNIQRLVDPVKDASAGLADVSHASHHDGVDGIKDDDHGCSTLLPDQCKHQKVTQSDEDLACSASHLHQLVEDLLFLAVDPLYGIERGCPEEICQAFLIFRSLTYRKIQASSNIGETSKHVEPCIHIEGEDDKKEADVVEEPLISWSGDKNVNVEHESNNVVVQSGSNGVAIDVCSNAKSITKLSNTTRSHEAGTRARERKNRKFDTQSDSFSKTAKKLKASNLPDKFGSKQNTNRLSGMSGGDSREPVQQRKKTSRSSDSHKTPEEPMALCMKFPQGFALPSEAQLKARFVRFGQLDISGTRIYCQTGCARVVFKCASDAGAAYKYATRNSLFGQANVKFRLKPVCQPKEETVVLQSSSESLKKGPVVFQSTDEPLKERKPSCEEAPSPLPDTLKTSIEDVPSSLSDNEIRDLGPSGLSGPKDEEALGDGTPTYEVQSSPLVQLKSCLKKPDESGNNSAKEFARVTFLLEKELGSDLDDWKNGLSQTESSSDFMSAVGPVHVNNSVVAPDLPDVSNQMLYLLKKCSEVVGDVRSTLGFVPYHYSV